MTKGIRFSYIELKHRNNKSMILNDSVCKYWIYKKQYHFEQILYIIDNHLLY